jgi:hypothetical protein
LVLANATSPRALHRKQSAHRAAQRSAAQRSAEYRNQLAAHRSTLSALYRTPCIAAHYAASRAAQRTHCPPRITITHLAPAKVLALRSTLRWFRLVRGTNFSKIQFIYVSNCNSVMFA